MAQQISQVTIPILGTFDSISVSVNPFELFPETIIVHFNLSGPESTYQGNMELPESIVNLWGTDDSVVLNYVVSQLGLTLIEETNPQD